MIFEKVDRPGSTATIQLTTEPDGGPVAVIRYTEGGGRSRTKRLKTPGRSSPSTHELIAKATIDRALLVLLKGGYVVRPAHGAAIVWMTYSDVGPPMGLPLAADDAGRVWIGGTGSLSRIDRATADTLSVPVGDGVIVSHVAAAPNGQVAALAELVQGGSYRVLRVVDATSTALVASVDFTKFTCLRMACSVSVDGRGRVLGPHEDGAALYEPDGTVVRTFPARNTGHVFPVAAINAAGTSVATTLADGKIRLVDLATGKERSLGGPFASVGALAVRADGSVDVWWADAGESGFSRVSAEGRCTRLAHEPTTYGGVAYGGVTHDGQHIAACEGGTLTIREIRTGRLLRSAPILGAGRSARVCFSEDGQVVARTDSGITVAFDPARIQQTTSAESLL